MLLRNRGKSERRLDPATQMECQLSFPAMRLRRTVDVGRNASRATIRPAVTRAAGRAVCSMLNIRLTSTGIRTTLLRTKTLVLRHRREEVLPPQWPDHGETICWKDRWVSISHRGTMTCTGQAAKSNAGNMVLDQIHRQRVLKMANRVMEALRMMTTMMPRRVRRAVAVSGVTRRRWQESIGRKGWYQFETGEFERRQYHDRHGSRPRVIGLHVWQGDRDGSPHRWVPGQHFLRFGTGGVEL